MMSTDKPTLNDEQSLAITAILTWLDSDEPFYLLSGSAGTGKTFCVRELASRIKGRIVFTAPTNKAVKVLRDSLTEPSYKPECRTIFSLLGLRLEANGEVKELTSPEDPVDLGSYRLVVVDEASMNNRHLMAAIREANSLAQTKFLFLGDPAQLPPVGEASSEVWRIEQTSQLLTVMRHDNEILELATRLRKVVDHPAPNIKLASANDGVEGVWLAPTADWFNKAVLKAAEDGLFTNNRVKAIAWRNETVGKLNQLIRARIFDDVALPWLPGDRVIFTAPAKDLGDETIATTDDEGVVVRASEDWHPNYQDFQMYRITIALEPENRLVMALVLHPASQRDFAARHLQLLEKAKANSRNWRHYWDFREAFHSLRHAYAITAHRAQGSTYESVFVDWRDILLNRNRQEAFRCLYVACTRPRKKLILN